MDRMDRMTAWANSFLISFRHLLSSVLQISASYSNCDKKELREAPND